MRYRIGIDLGGTNIKAGIVNEENEILLNKQIPTHAGRPAEEVIRDMAGLVDRLIWEGGKVSGLEVAINGKPQTLRASSEVILSAGTYGSAAILLLKGVIVFSVLKCFKMPGRPAMLAAGSLASTGEFSLVLIGKAGGYRPFYPATEQMLLVCTAVTMAAVPTLMRMAVPFANSRHAPSRQASSAQSSTRCPRGRCSRRLTTLNVTGRPRSRTSSGVVTASSVVQ